MVMAVRGDKAHERRLAAMRSPQAQRLIVQALYVGGTEIEIEARLSITAGSVSGKGHVASRPGEPPNRDTGRLDTSITTTIVGTGVVEVSANAPYAAVLEFGGSKVQERPFMRPAAAKKRGKVSELVSKAVDKIIRDS